MKGATIGTPAYMSPEQIEGKGAIDGRADIYSLGCVLYEMLAGTTPFTGGWPLLAYQHVSVEPRPINESRPDLPDRIVRAVMKSLAKDPASRFSTAAEFVDALISPSADVAADVATLSLPPPALTPPIANNLPRERTRFIGRTEELAECSSLLRSTHLLILTGLGRLRQDEAGNQAGRESCRLFCRRSVLCGLVATGRRRQGVRDHSSTVWNPRGG